MNDFIHLSMEFSLLIAHRYGSALRAHRCSIGEAVGPDAMSSYIQNLNYLLSNLRINCVLFTSKFLQNLIFLQSLLESQLLKRVSVKSEPAMIHDADVAESLPNLFQYSSNNCSLHVEGQQQSWRLAMHVEGYGSIARKSRAERVTPIFVSYV